MQIGDFVYCVATDDYRKCVVRSGQIVSEINTVEDLDTEELVGNPVKYFKVKYVMGGSYDGAWLANTTSKTEDIVLATEVFATEEVAQRHVQEVQRRVNIAYERKQQEKLQECKNIARGLISEFENNNSDMYVICNQLLSKTEVTWNNRDDAINNLGRMIFNGMIETNSVSSQCAKLLGENFGLKSLKDLQEV